MNGDDKKGNDARNELRGYTIIPNTGERIRGALFGCAVGDTLGMAVEGWKREQIAAYVGTIAAPRAPFFPTNDDGSPITEDAHGPIKRWHHTLQEGDVTDDTLLTMAIARAIAKRWYDLDAVAHEHVATYQRQKQPDGTVIGGFGRTTIAALERLAQGTPPTKSAIDGWPGNAPAMKMAPIGLAMAWDGDIRTGVEFAESVSSMTHRDTRSIASGAAQAYAVYCAANQYTRDEFIDQIEIVLSAREKEPRQDSPDTNRHKLHQQVLWVQHHRHASIDEARTHLRNSSKVYESYPFALFMTYRFWNDPVTGVIETVNQGGDCDTTGAIVGSILGARHGDIWPKEWIDKLRCKEELESVCHALEEKMIADYIDNSFQYAPQKKDPFK